MKTVSEAEKAAARKAGKLPKAPKKPKRTASVAALEAYAARHDAWCDKIKAMAAKAKKREGLVKQIFK